MNNYCRRSQLKTDIGKTTTVDDAALLRIMGAVSRGIDRGLNRIVYSQLATRYYTGNGKLRLPLFDDVQTVTTLKVATGADPATFDTTLVADTDYYLTPDNRDWEPATAIEANPYSTSIGLPFPPGRRRVQLVGRFGYSALSEATGQTVQNATEITAGGTALTVTSTADIDAGEVLVLGTEEVYVSAVTSPTGLTIQRAVNGTTAAAHANGVAISRRRYPEDIEEACRMQVARFFREKRSGGQMGDAETGGYAFSSMWPAIRDLLGPHIRHVVG